MFFRRDSPNITRDYRSPITDHTKQSLIPRRQKTLSKREDNAEKLYQQDLRLVLSRFSLTKETLANRDTRSPSNGRRTGRRKMWNSRLVYATWGLWAIESAEREFRLHISLFSTACPPPNRHANPSFLTSSTSGFFINLAPLENSIQMPSDRLFRDSPPAGHGRNMKIPPNIVSRYLVCITRLPYRRLALLIFALRMYARLTRCFIEENFSLPCSRKRDRTDSGRFQFMQMVSTRDFYLRNSIKNILLKY